MKPQAALAVIAASILTVAAGFAPASAARSSYVIDDAHLLSQTAIAQINQQVGDFNAQTGKEVVVVTTDSLGGTDPNVAVERSFAQQQVNGVEIFIAKNEKQIKIAGDKASHQFFPPGSFSTIYQAMRPSFAQGNFDQGVETGVSLVLNTYRGHVSSLNGARRPVGAAAPVRVRTSNSGGFNLGFIWWIIILAVIFFIIRGIFRAMSGPRNYGGGGPGYGPGYGGPGYGGGGYGGGGGSFWSGMLGGLGGAFLGNELFGNRGGGNVVGGEGGSYASTGGDPGTTPDAGGWQSDAGQIDTSNTGGGGWGDSSSSGGGDSGGGWGGGDSGGGGGGGDSGGGW
jgi:uncharacterized membrane protein YgcG